MEGLDMDKLSMNPSANEGAAMPPSPGRGPCHYFVIFQLKTLSPSRFSSFLCHRTQAEIKLKLSWK